MKLNVLNDNEVENLNDNKVEKFKRYLKLRWRKTLKKPKKFLKKL